MPRIFLALLLAAPFATADPGFVLGIDYSQWLQSEAKQIMTDSSGALYVLTGGVSSSTTPRSIVTKISAEGTVPRPIDGGVTGFPLPVNIAQVTAEIEVMIRFPGGGLDARATDVTYAGPAPFQPAGVSQINLRVGESGQALHLLIQGVRTQSVQVYISPR